MIVKWRTFAGVAAVGAAVLGYQLLNPERVYTRHVPITTKIVFNREIAAIFQKKCFQCHTENNSGVPLTTYKEARPWAVAIKEEILERRMASSASISLRVVMPPAAVSLRSVALATAVIAAMSVPCIRPSLST